MKGNLFMLQHPTESPELSYQPHLHFSSAERAASNAQSVNLVHMGFSHVSRMNNMVGVLFFLAWKKLKMYCLHFLVSFFHFSYQIWFASYDRITFCQIPLISTPSSPAAQESCETSAAFLEALALLLVEKTPWNPDLRNSHRLWVSGSWPRALHIFIVGILPPGAASES